MADISALLIVAPNWLGDAVMALPAMRDLRSLAPAARLVVAVRRPLADLFSLVPGVDHVIPLDWRGRLFDDARCRADARAVAATGADAAVLFPNSFASAWLVRRAGIRQRWGYAADARRLLLTRAVARPAGSVHQVEYYQQLVRSLGAVTGSAEPLLRIPDAAREACASRLAALGWDAARPLVVVAPGAAYGGAKRWPPEHFAALIEALVHEQGATCVLVGSGADRSTTSEIGQRLAPASRSQVIDVTGETSIVELAAAMALARLCVTNDSGALHVAAAAGVAVVALFGPTREYETAPSPSPRRTIDVLVNPVSCRPCMLRECPIDHRCLRGLLPRQALDASSAVLRRARPAGPPPEPPPPSGVAR